MPKSKFEGQLLDTIAHGSASLSGEAPVPLTISPPTTISPGLAGDVRFAGGHGFALDVHRSLIFLQFRAFYAEVVRLKKLALRNPGTFRPAPMSDYGPESGPTQVARAISQHLESVLARQMLEAGRQRGESSGAFYHDAHFAMAALADEVFMHSAWAGREAWPAQSLESRLFQSQIAGEQVFLNVDTLLAEQNPERRDIAAVYLLVLSLGFQGRYRGTHQLYRVYDYRQRLFEHVYRRPPVLQHEDARLFPEVYTHTLEQPIGAVLPTLRPWAIAAGALLAVFLIFSHLMWRSVTADLRALTSRIEAVTRDTGS